jgi:acetoacetate decarboxylase
MQVSGRVHMATASCGPMREDNVRKLPSMPAAGPSYPVGPYLTYETDPEVIRAQPEPLESIPQPLIH